MSRTIHVADIQRAIGDIRAWANGDTDIEEDPASDLLRAMADLLEALLCSRDARA